MPIAPGNLYSSLYPDEYFNPDSSPNRMYQVVQRLRKWYRDNNIPLNVKVDKNHFLLEMKGDYGILLPKTYQKMGNEQYHAYLNRLREEWPYKTFSGGEAQKFLEISKSSFFKFSSWATTNKKLYKSGTGRSTLYRLKK